MHIEPAADLSVHDRAIVMDRQMAVGAAENRPRLRRGTSRRRYRDSRDTALRSRYDRAASRAPDHREVAVLESLVARRAVRVAPCANGHRGGAVRVWVLGGDRDRAVAAMRAVSGAIPSRSVTASAGSIGICTNWSKVAELAAARMSLFFDGSKICELSAVSRHDQCDAEGRHRLDAQAGGRLTVIFSRAFACRSGAV